MVLLSKTQNTGHDLQKPNLSIGESGDSVDGPCSEAREFVKLHTFKSRDSCCSAAACVARYVALLAVMDNICESDSQITSAL